MSEVTIKLIPGFRNHLLIVVHFVDGYLKCVENGINLDHEEITLPPTDFFSAITTAVEVEALRNKLVATEENESVQLSNRENVLLYACFVLMSYGLITPLGEMLSETIIGAMPAGHPFREFTEFRNSNLKLNAHLIENAAQTLDEIPDFAQMKEALAGLSAD